jgi:hypothetical protein
MLCLTKKCNNQLVFNQDCLSAIQKITVLVSKISSMLDINDNFDDLCIWEDALDTSCCKSVGNPQEKDEYFVFLLVKFSR